MIRLLAFAVSFVVGVFVGSALEDARRRREWLELWEREGVEL